MCQQGTTVEGNPRCCPCGWIYIEGVGCCPSEGACRSPSILSGQFGNIGIFDFSQYVPIDTCNE
jgi:hypothetical protein